MSRLIRVRADLHRRVERPPRMNFDGLLFRALFPQRETVDRRTPRRIEDKHHRKFLDANPLEQVRNENLGRNVTGEATIVHESVDVAIELDICDRYLVVGVALDICGEQRKLIQKVTRYRLSSSWRSRSSRVRLPCLPNLRARCEYESANGEAGGPQRRPSRHPTSRKSSGSPS